MAKLSCFNVNNTIIIQRIYIFLFQGAVHWPGSGVLQT